MNLGKELNIEKLNEHPKSACSEWLLGDIYSSFLGLILNYA